ncbi:MAG: hypothetical protein RBU29_04530 [bacterium]|jgi:uncharacterized protein (TIGR02001 family)|nr:hypothetical protein [bacterium]
MKKLWISVLAVCLLTSLAGPLPAVEIGGQTIDITADFTYATKYMWHGYDIFEGNGAFQPSLELGWNGFYTGFWTSYADTRGYDDLTEFDYYFGYGYTFFAEEQYAVEASVTYTYFDFPSTSSWELDASELAFAISMPNLIPLGPSNLVPGYTLYYDFDGKDSDIDDGFFQTFSLSYSIPFQALIPEQEEQSLDLFVDVTYDDGALGAQSGWSYSTIGASTTFEYKGFYFTPAIAYQYELDSGVSPAIEDDFYATFSIGYTF